MSVSLLKHMAVKKCEEITCEISSELWYKELQGEIIEIQKKICKNEELKILLNKYDELCLQLHSNTEEKLYICGYLDGKTATKERYP